VELRNKLKVGIKFCGGCNPTFDRISASLEIKKALKDEVVFTDYRESGVDLILAFMGCKSACADLTGVEHNKIRFICNKEDADSVIDEILMLRKN